MDPQSDSERVHEEPVSDEYQEELDDKEPDSVHPNDVDELVVNINASEAIAIEGVNVNLESSPASSEHNSQAGVESYKDIRIDETSAKPIIKQLRDQMRLIHTDEEIAYWWDMCNPREVDVEHEARRALEPPPKSENMTRKRKREERKQRAVDRGDVQGGGKSETYKARAGFLNSVFTADVSMREALNHKYVCDGDDLPMFDAKKMCDELRKDHRRPTTSRQSRSRSAATDKPAQVPKPVYWSSERVAKSLGYNLVAAEDLKQLPGHSFSVYDLNNNPIIFSLANYFGPQATKDYTSDLEELATQVKLVTRQADANTRGSNYSLKDGRAAGCVNVTYAWRGLGGKIGDLKPSTSNVNGGHTSVTKSATTFNSIQTHHKKSRPINTLVNYSLFRLHRAGFWAYLRMSNTIRKRIPAARAVATHDPAFSTGKSVIYSRSTPRHFDNKEAPEGWSPLVIMGTCKTGMLSIPRLGIKFPYLPGHLVLLRGRLLDHEVIEWDGDGTRICVAHFTHVDEWKYAGVVPPL